LTTAGKKKGKKKIQTKKVEGEKECLKGGEQSFHQRVRIFKGQQRLLGDFGGEEDHGKGGWKLRNAEGKGDVRMRQVYSFRACPNQRRTGTTGGSSRVKGGPKRNCRRKLIEKIRRCWKPKARGSQKKL